MNSYCSNSVRTALLFPAISKEDSEWLVLIHQLPDDAQLEFKGELKGYIKCLKRDVGEPAGLREAK